MTDTWYPKTTADVMGLPEGSFIKTHEVTCPYCKHVILVPTSRRASIKPYHDDLVMFCVDENGDAWTPEYDSEDGWYRRRASI